MKTPHHYENSNSTDTSTSDVDTNMVHKSTFQPTHLTILQLAARWDLDPKTLEKWRGQRKGPDFIKLGRKKVLYPLTSVLAFEQAAVVRTFK